MISPDEQGSGEPRPAGPVTAGDPPPPAVAKASSGVGPPTVPPAGEGSEDSRDGGGAADSEGAGADESERVKASPVARRIAKEKGIDLSTIEGSGPGGRIVKKDVKNATPAAAEEPG